MRPKRIQRKRVLGWRMPENTVYVGRPTKWGNPFIGDDAIKKYEEMIMFKMLDGDAFKKELLELKGKNLACWCPLFDKNGLPIKCHADILLELANR